MADRRKSRSTQLVVLTPSHGKRTQATPSLSSNLPLQSKETTKKKRNTRKEEAELIQTPASERNIDAMTPAKISFDDDAASCKETKLKSKAKDLETADKDDAKALTFETPAAKTSGLKRSKKNPAASKRKNKPESSTAADTNRDEASETSRSVDSPVISTREHTDPSATAEANHEEGADTSSSCSSVYVELPSSSVDLELFSQLLEVFAHDEDDESQHPELLGFALSICQSGSVPELDEDLHVKAHARLEASFACVSELDDASIFQDGERTTILCHQICVCLALLRCTRKSVAPKSKRTKANSHSDNLMKDALEVLGKILKALSSSTVDADKKKRKSKKQTSTTTTIAGPVCECLQSLVEVVKRMAATDEHLVSITRIAVDGLLCAGNPVVQELGCAALAAICSRSTDHRRSVLEEVFLTLDDERLQPLDKVDKCIPIEYTDKKIRPVSAALLRLFQSVQKSASDQDSSFEMAVKSSACYLLRLFEGRFVRDEHKKTAVEKAAMQQKDMDSKTWLETFIEDLFTVFALPQFPVAELLLATFVDKFQNMLMKAETGERLSDRAKAIVTDLAGSILARLVAVRRDAASTPAVGALDEQELYAGQVRPCGAEGAWNDTDEVGIRELVVSGLGNKQDPGSQDALVFLKALWGWPETEGVKKKKGKEKACGPLPPAPPSPEGLMRSCLSLALHSSLLNRLENRVNAFVLQLVREGTKSGDRQRVLKTANEIFDVDMSCVHSSFLKVVQRSYLFDPSNAGVRSSAVELLGKAILSEMKLKPGKDVDEHFETLASRSLDTSIKVRTAVLSFLREVCDLERASVAIATNDRHALVGMFLAKSTVQGDGSIIGKVVRFDPRKNIFEVDYADGEVEKLPEESVWGSLLFGTRPASSGGALGALPACFEVRPRFVAAASKAAAMLLYGIRGHEEDTIMERAVALFTSLWFKRDSTVPCNLRLQEIEEAVLSTDSGQWLEVVLRSAKDDSQVAEVSSWYVDQLFSKIAAIHNPGGRNSPSQRPSAFNDFQTRVPFAKAAPDLFCRRLHELAPILREREVCREHGVARSLLDVLDAAVGSGGQLPAEVEGLLLTAFHSGALKLNDPKRFAKTDEISRAVKCFCQVVKWNPSPAAERALLGTFLQCVQFLEKYINNPVETHVVWVPRSLILAGAIIRYCDLSALSARGADTVASNREQLYLMVLTHYSNHLLEPGGAPGACLRAQNAMPGTDRGDAAVKKASLYVIGSVLVHEPEKALHKACMKLLFKSLSAGSAPSLQSQVLRNLHDQFQIEDDRLAALASSDSTTAEQHAGDVGNTSTSVMHKFHDQIFLSSLSPNINVRFDAVSLILLILRRGMTATYLAIPYLIAQQAMSDGPSLLALQALDTIREKETTHYQAHAFWEGIVKSTSLCRSESELARTSFGAAFRHLASGNKDGFRAVRQLLQCVASKFDKFSPTEGDISVQTSFEFKLYVASIVANLPFQHLDGPLFFIHSIQNTVTVLAGGCLEGLGAVCQNREDVAEEAVERWRQEGACVALLLSVQAYLQSEYAIKTDRIKKFISQPDNVDKTARARNEEGTAFRPICLFQGKWRQDQDVESLQEDDARLRSLLHGDLFAESLGDSLTSVSDMLAETSGTGPDGTETAPAKPEGRRGKTPRGVAKETASSQESLAEPLEAETRPVKARRGKKSRGGAAAKEPSSQDSETESVEAEHEEGQKRRRRAAPSSKRGRGGKQNDDEEEDAEPPVEAGPERKRRKRTL